MKSLSEYLIVEKLNYTNKVTKKICKAFGLTENDNWTDAIDKWVNDNDVQRVKFYTDNLDDLKKDMHMPKNIIAMYNDGDDDYYDYVEEIHKSLSKDSKKLEGDEWFMIKGNTKVLVFASQGNDSSLYAVKI